MALHLRPGGPAANHLRPWRQGAARIFALASLAGSDLTIAITGFAGPIAPPALTALTVGGVDALPGVGNATLPDIASGFVPGNKFGNSALCSLTRDDLQPGDPVLIMYEITSGIGNPFLDGGANSTLVVTGKMPGGVGSHVVLAEVRSTYVPGTGTVANVLRNAGAGATVYSSMTLYRPVWSVDLSSANSGDAVAWTVSAGEISRSNTVHVPTPGEWHVSPAAAPGGTGAELSPFASVADTHSVVSPGDTVYLHPGVHAPFEVPISGTAGNEVTYRTRPGEERLAHIRGDLLQHTTYGGPGVAATPDNSVRDGIRIDGKSYITVKDLEISHCWRNGVFIIGAGPDTITQHLTVTGCEIHDVGLSAVYVCGDIGSSPVAANDAFRTRNVTVTFNDITQTNVVTDHNINQLNSDGEPGGVGEAITIANSVQYVYVNDNDLHDSRQYGIDFKNHVVDGEIRRNRIANFERHGLYLDAGETDIRRVLISDNVVAGCGAGIVLSREEDGDDSGDDLALVDIDVFNNVFANIQRLGIYAQRHAPKDQQDIGYITNIRFRFNTLYNTNIEGTTRDINIDDWVTFGTNIAGDPVVSGVELVGNLAWNPGGVMRMRTDVMGDSRFTLAGNLNCGNGTTTGVDPLFTDPAALDFTLQAGSPGIGIVSGYSEAPFDVTVDGATRGDPADAGAAEPAPREAAITAMVMGQSELEYLFNIGPYYRAIPQPTPADGNLIVITQGDVGVAPVRTEVNASTVGAGQVNPAMAAMSAFLGFAAPGQKFAVGDGAVSGTSRTSLCSEDLSDIGQQGHRRMSDFTAVVGMIEAEFGPVENLIECWYNSDAQSIATFKTSFWPHYFGLNGDGTTFALGSTIPAGYTIDHCLYDGDAPVDQKGRGVFARAETQWRMITPMPFFNPPADPAPEALNYSAYDGRLTEPDRQVVIDLAQEAEAQSVNLVVGPSMHVAKFGPNDALHPDVADPDGQILTMWPIALSLLRAAGETIHEPVVLGVSGPETGEHVDIEVSLPNGGTLTTLEQHRLPFAKAKAATIEELAYNPVATGARLADGEYSVVGQDALPGGWVHDPVNQYVRANADAPSLEGWDLGANEVQFAGANTGDLIDCIIRHVPGKSFGIRVDPGCGTALKNCTIIGSGYGVTGSVAVHCLYSGTDQNAVLTEMRGIESCAFLRWPADVIKWASNQDAAIAGNYFDVPETLPYAPPDYDPGVTYSAMELVFGPYVLPNQPKTYRSKIDGNIGRALTDTDAWVELDNHLDFIQVAAMGASSTLDIVGNFFAVPEALRRAGTGVRQPDSFGSAIRGVADIGTLPFGHLRLRRNIITWDETESGFPVSITGGGEVIDNLITPNRTGAYWAAGTELANTLSGNSDYTVVAPIPRPATPQRQAVTGFELARASARRPLFRVGDTAYPEAYRGSVHILDAGSGQPKTGKVRITPEQPFAFGDSVSYLRGQANAATLSPRDYNMYNAMLIEHVPGLHDATARYPFEGIAVRPYQAELPIPVAPPSFATRGATFNGTNTTLYNPDIASVVGTQGMIAGWVRNTAPSWGTPQRYVFEARVNNVPYSTLRSLGAGVMNFTLGVNGSPDRRAINVFAPGATVMALGEWYHIMITWQAGGTLKGYCNGVETASVAMGPVDLAGQEMDVVTIGADQNGQDKWLGDMAHLFIDLGRTLDMSVLANRELFIAAGEQVDVGVSGQTPFGSPPAMYFDGEVPGWNNQGAATAFDVNGTFAASSVPTLN